LVLTSKNERLEADIKSLQTKLTETDGKLNAALSMVNEMRAKHDGALSTIEQQGEEINKLKAEMVTSVAGLGETIEKLASLEVVMKSIGGFLKETVEKISDRSKP
jgi:uncharacterized coiled-coil DUF342 family protein